MASAIMTSSIPNAACSQLGSVVSSIDSASTCSHHPHQLMLCHEAMEQADGLVRRQYDHQVYNHPRPVSIPVYVRPNHPALYQISRHLHPRPIVVHTTPARLQRISPTCSPPHCSYSCVGPPSYSGMSSAASSIHDHRPVYVTRQSCQQQCLAGVEPGRSSPVEVPRSGGAGPSGGFGSTSCPKPACPPCDAQSAQQTINPAQAARQAFAVTHVDRCKAQAGFHMPAAFAGLDPTALTFTARVDNRGACAGINSGADMNCGRPGLLYTTRCDCRGAQAGVNLPVDPKPGAPGVVYTSRVDTTGTQAGFNLPDRQCGGPSILYTTKADPGGVTAGFNLASADRKIGQPGVLYTTRVDPSGGQAGFHLSRQPCPAQPCPTGCPGGNQGRCGLGCSGRGCGGGPPPSWEERRCAINSHAMTEIQRGGKGGGYINRQEQERASTEDESTPSQSPNQRPTGQMGMPTYSMPAFSNYPSQWATNQRSMMQGPRFMGGSGSMGHPRGQSMQMPDRMHSMQDRRSSQPSQPSQGPSQGSVGSVGGGGSGGGGSGGSASQSQGAPCCNAGGAGGRGLPGCGAGGAICPGRFGHYCTTHVGRGQTLAGVVTPGGAYCNTNADPRHVQSGIAGPGGLYGTMNLERNRAQVGVVNLRGNYYINSNVDACQSGAAFTFGPRCQ